MLGQQVRVLANSSVPAGRYTVTWDGHDDHGRVVGSGMYLYRLTAGEQAIARKMLFMK
jgi:flagellar hook assembly protein FlgD